MTQNIFVRLWGDRKSHSCLTARGKLPGFEMPVYESQFTNPFWKANDHCRIRPGGITSWLTCTKLRAQETIVQKHEFSITFVTVWVNSRGNRIFWFPMFGALKKDGQFMCSNKGWSVADLFLKIIDECALPECLSPPWSVSRSGSCQQTNGVSEQFRFPWKSRGTQFRLKDTYFGIHIKKRNVNFFA